MERPPTERVTLDALAQKHRTDKRGGLHGYTRYYDRLFSPKRDDPIRLLEIGVLSGSSLRMWADYFPSGLIFGIDIKPSCMQHASDRISIALVNQSDGPSLESYARQFGPWDIVIDDGSHKTSDQIQSFELLWPSVLPGGYYVVEDAFASFIPSFADQERHLFSFFEAFARENFRGCWYSDESRTEVDLMEWSVGLIVVKRAPRSP